MIIILQTKGVAHQWTSHEKTSVLWSKSRLNEVWTEGRNDSVKLWDIGDGSPVVKATFPLVNYLGFSSCDFISLDNGDSFLAIPGPNQECVTIFDVKTNCKICLIKHFDISKEGSVMQVKWINLSDELFILVLYESGCLTLWNWSNNSIINQIKLTENPMCVDFNEVTLQGICGTASESHFIFTVTKNGIVLENNFDIINPGLSTCSSRPDGKIFATGGWDSRIRLFRWKKCKPLAVLTYHKQTVQCLSFSNTDVEHFPSGYILAAGSMDHNISLWNIYNN